MKAQVALEMIAHITKILQLHSQRGDLEQLKKSKK